MESICTQRSNKRCIHRDPLSSSTPVHPPPSRYLTYNPSHIRPGSFHASPHLFSPPPTSHTRSEEGNEKTEKVLLTCPIKYSSDGAAGLNGHRAEQRGCVDEVQDRGADRAQGAGECFWYDIDMIRFLDLGLTVFTLFSVSNSNIPAYFRLEHPRCLDPAHVHPRRPITR